MTQGTATSRQQGLRQAAAVIFALVAIVPLLTFAWTLHALDVTKRTEAQVGLALSLAVALLGFWMFRVMLGRMSEVVQALVAAVDQANRVRRPTHAEPQPAAVAATPVAGTAATVATAATAAKPAAHPSAPAASGAALEAARAKVIAPSPFATAPVSRDRALPGIGAIREFGEVTRTMGALWQREAKAHLGRRVQISVANSREPLVGTLSEVSDDGLILELPDEPIAIAYRRITAIEGLATAPA
jgi:hypothetical protein